MDTKKMFPQVSVKVQLFFAAAFWLIGSVMVLRMGINFMGVVSWPWWLVIIGLGLGFAKSQFIMVKTARRTVDRAYGHGRDWLFNMYAPKTWLLVGGMIVLGILLRTFGPTDHTVYQHFLAGLYLAVSLGLLLSDRIYWMAFFRKS